MKKTISFIRAGEKPEATARETPGLLNTIQDLGSYLKFPQHVAKTTLRPDIILVSEARKNVVIMELTVPWEGCMEEAFECKRGNYDSLVSDCHR